MFVKTKLLCLKYHKSKFNLKKVFAFASIQIKPALDKCRISSFRIYPSFFLNLAPQPLNYYNSLGLTALNSIILIILIIIAVAFFTLFERKFMASIQRRLGPNIAGPWGLLQALVDGLKLVFKEIIIPQKANKVLFILAPCITFFFSLLGWAVIPFGEYLVISDLSVGVLFIMTLFALNSYGVVIAGWASNSKYPILASFRTIAQVISYELSLGLIISTVALCSGSLNLTDIVIAQKFIWFIIPLFPIAVCFLICMLAETNRTPFDLPEAEAELVAGYNLEYSGIIFAFFFLGEYSNMLLMSALFSIFFLGGWHRFFILWYWPDVMFFAAKICFICGFFVLTRATFPRYRYDQLLIIGWKVLLPFTISYFIFMMGILYSFDLYSSKYFLEFPHN